MNTILHETPTRLRLQAPATGDLDALAVRLRAVAGVSGVRPNRALGCVTVQVDGLPATRRAVLRALEAAPGGGTRRGAKGRSAPAAAGERLPGGRDGRSPPGSAAARASWRARHHVAPAVDWTAGLLAAALPLMPAGWRPGGALGVVAARLLGQRARLRSDAPAVLLDSVAQASLAVNGQPLVVSASVLMRLLTEGLSRRMVSETDGLLEHLLPEPAAQYRVLRGPGEPDHWWPLRRVRAGDRLRLFAGDIVPVDGCVAEGEGRLQPVARADAPRDVLAGAHVAAGERVLAGTFELRAESDAAGSRLERLRAQLRHAMAARDPAGRLAPDLERLVSLPLTGAALVLGLTGDRARAAAMLQADPQRGLDLALPVAREAALLALARLGLVTNGLEALERLARASTLVLQDTGVLANGRWQLGLLRVEPGGDAGQVRQWLAALAGVPLAALAEGGLPDLLVRQWVRHGALLRLGAHELHLASPRRLRSVWQLDVASLEGGHGGDPGPADAGALVRHFGLVAEGRVVARVTLLSRWREGLEARLLGLRELGFERIAVFVEDDGNVEDDEKLHPSGPDASGVHGATDAPRNRPPLDASIGAAVEWLGAHPLARSDWLAEAGHAGEPLVLLHTVLRDLVPPGSLSLTPTEAEAGAHGVLLGDPLADLERARQLAQRVHRRLRLHQGAAAGANALLMTASALRWMPPMATTLLNHGFALLVLLDSLRIESLGGRDGPAAPSPSPAGQASPPARAPSPAAHAPRSKKPRSTPA